jgi:hypothetical protein
MAECDQYAPNDSNRAANNRLHKARAKKAGLVNKGVKQKIANTDPAAIRRVCNKGQQRCGCANLPCGTPVNCYSKVNFETAEHYRMMLYNEDDKGVNQAFRRQFMRTMLIKFHDEAKKKQAKLHKTSQAMRLDYYLEDFAYTNPANPREVKKVNVCRKVFENVLGPSHQTWSNVYDEVVNRGLRSFPDDEESQRKVQGKSDEWLACATFLSFLLDDLADMSPDTRGHELPSGFKRDYYEMFCNDWNLGVLNGAYTRSKNKFKKQPTKANAENLDLDPPNDGAGDEANLKPPSISFFYRVWRTEFKDVTVPRRHNRFSKCDLCCSLKGQLGRATDNKEKRRIKILLFEHYAWVTLQRRKYHWHRKKAMDKPDE